MDQNLPQILYPKAALLSENKKEPAFRTCDTHMTDFGNLVIAQAILSYFKEDTQCLATLKERREARLGDLTKMACITSPISERRLQSPHNMNQIWDNRAFLKSNTDNIAISYNPKSYSTKRLLAIGDSFFKDSMKFLSIFYRDIFYIRSDLFQSDAAHLFAPDAIITSNAERYLSNIKLDADGTSILLRCFNKDDYHP